MTKCLLARLAKWKTIHDDFHCVEESITDLSSGIIRGRLPGGVAIQDLLMRLGLMSTGVLVYS